MILEQETIEKYRHFPSLLAQTSTKLCILQCDYCQQIFERTMKEINRGNKKISLDACKKDECKNKKSSDVYNQTTAKDIENINNKRKTTCIEKFGVDNAAKSLEKQSKMHQTMIERYGVEYALQSKDILIRKNATMIETYGTLSNLEASGRKEEIIEKLKAKALSTVEKGKITCLKAYGVDNAQKVKTICEITQRTLIERHGENFFSDISKMADIIIVCKNKNYELLSKEEDYVSQTSLLSLRCTKHDFEFKSKLVYLRTAFNQCPKCRNYNTSKQEKEIFSFINEIYDGEISLNTREIIGKELDLFLPEKKFAIEHHGLYWHCELYKHYKSHSRKFKKCKEKGIYLFQIYGDEWRDKKEICKSMIKNKLGLTENKLYARKLNITSIKKHDYNNFLHENHLMGAYTATNVKREKCFALVDDSQKIVCCIVAKKIFAKANENNKNALEITRFGTLINTNVIGGFSRLLKYIKLWGKEEGYNKIITYSDARYSVGDVYKKNGFELTKKTMPNYYYTNFTNRFNKYSYRAKNGKSESEIVAELDLYKIYDAGKFVWELTL